MLIEDVIFAFAFAAFALILSAVVFWVQSGEDDDI